MILYPMSFYPIIKERRVIKCRACGIETAHVQDDHGRWTCWCSNIDDQPEAEAQAAEAAEVDEWLGSETGVK